MSKRAIRPRGLGAGDSALRRLTPATPMRLRVVALAAIWFLIVATGNYFTGTASGQAPPPDVPVPLDTLQGAKPPPIENLHLFVRDEQAGVELGKALFWDMQAGSDGVTACASCHFNAGADSRSVNQLNPSLGGFDTGGPNYRLRAKDFPFHKEAGGAVVSDSNDVVSSQGVFFTAFNRIASGKALDGAALQRDPVFHVDGSNVRRVEPLNTPTVVNSVFNFRNFWNGRAQNDFNGVNPFGSRDANAKVIRVGAAGGLRQVQVSLDNSSLASQAVGPPLSDTEMSAAGRTFKDVGRKMLALRPLARQGYVAETAF